jgi:transposase InsO family protein
MYMAYTTNPHLPKVRMESVRLVKYRHWSMRKVARHIGVDVSTISRWCAHPCGTGWMQIPTKSSRPHHHPDEISKELENTVIKYRLEHNRCAKVIHHLLEKDDFDISLSTVERVFRRRGLVQHPYNRSPHQYPPRPLPENPGILVEIDTIVDGPYTECLYIYTLLDVYSRFAFALPSESKNTIESIKFLREAIKFVPFQMQTIQSDHGSEFSRRFTERLLYQGLSHRHSRIRTPNDNGHLERFNRTIQEECINKIPRNINRYRKEITEYLEYYNNKRPHMGLNMKTPKEMLQSY